MRIFTALIMSVCLSLMFGSFADAQTNFRFEQSASTVSEHTVLLIGPDDMLSGAASVIDAETGGRLSMALADADFSGAFGAKLHLYGLTPYKSLTIVGTGDDEMDIPALRELGGHIAMVTKNDQSYTVMADGVRGIGDADAAEMATGFALGSYSFTKYKQDAVTPARTITFVSPEASASRTAYEGDLQYLVRGVYFARDMGTEPGASMYPARFAESVEGLFAGVPNVEITVLGVPEMEARNMGALMGVGKGSIHDPKLVVVEYRGGAAGDAPIALVGKGITFDTGGISLKSNSGMWLMKSDLSGAAAVAGTVYAAASRGENVNLVGVMAMAENMPAEDAIRPGDVLMTMSGKTIEIMSTDAEGRLVLSDAVRYAQDEFQPKLLVNIATLTGSAGRALGDDYAALITRDWDLGLEMMAIGKAAGEDVWPLPLNASHYSAITSDIADIKNTAGSPGASIGAAVIGTFVDEDQPWVHLDIAGVDWLTSSRPTSPKGHSGWGVRFMDGIVRAHAE